MIYQNFLTLFSIALRPLFCCSYRCTQNNYCLYGSRIADSTSCLFHPDFLIFELSCVSVLFFSLDACCGLCIVLYHPSSSLPGLIAPCLLHNLDIILDDCFHDLFHIIFCEWYTLACSIESFSSSDGVCGDFFPFGFIVDDNNPEQFALHSMLHRPRCTAMEPFFLFLGYLFVVLSVQYAAAAALYADSTEDSSKGRAYSFGVVRHNIILFVVDMKDKEDSIRSSDCICYSWAGCSIFRCSCERFLVLERFQNLHEFAECLEIYDGIIVLHSSDGYCITLEKAETIGSHLSHVLFLFHDFLFRLHVLWPNSGTPEDDITLAAPRNIEAVFNFICLSHNESLTPDSNTMLDTVITTSYSDLPYSTAIKCLFLLITLEYSIRASINSLLYYSFVILCTFCFELYIFRLNL
jgi:hypothetical protein